MAKVWPVHWPAMPGGLACRVALCQCRVCQCTVRDERVKLPETVYKILGIEEWDAALEAGEFTGSPVDLADGYLHFSTATQARETAAKHFAGRDDLILLVVASEPMARHYKMEVSRGGDLFPHLYANLPVSSVSQWQELPLGPDGAHVFPDGFPA